MAILAGFYTSKIITIASDKKRVLLRINETRNEIEWRTKKSKNLKSIMDERTREREDMRLQNFADKMKNSMQFTHIKNLDDLLKQYMEEWGDVSEYEKTKIGEMSESVLNEVSKRRQEQLEAFKSGIASGIAKRLEDATNLRVGYLTPNRDIAMERRREALKTIEEYNSEESSIQLLETQLASYENDLGSIIYPRHLKFRGLF